MAAWQAHILSQEKNQEGEGADITVEIRNVSIDYGFEGSFDHALIKSRHGYSWNPSSCGRRVDNPNIGNLSITLTQKLLKGSYSGVLYLCDARTAVKKAAVEGAFECALPALHDPLYEGDITQSEAYRTQAEAVWLYAGADNEFEALQRALPLLRASSRTDMRSDEQEPECDCSCPNLLTYDSSDPCRQGCGPESRFQACSEQQQEAKATSDVETEDVCARWERAQAGEGVSEVVAPMIATIAQGMDKDCADMSPEEKEAFEHMLNMMMGM